MSESTKCECPDVTMPNAYGAMCMGVTASKHESTHSARGTTHTAQRTAHSPLYTQHSALYTQHVAQRTDNSVKVAKSCALGAPAHYAPAGEARARAGAGDGGSMRGEGGGGTWQNDKRQAAGIRVGM